MDKIKVIITNKQKDIKIPTGLRMLIRRCCNAVLRMEEFPGSVEVSVTLVNNKQIRELNSIYREIDSRRPPRIAAASFKIDNHGGV